jgi:hypothetical protein
MADLDPSGRRLLVVEDGPLGQSCEPEFDAGIVQEPELMVRNPSRAVVNAAYVTPPPSRQPRGSSAVRSRLAEPTCTTSIAARVIPSSPSAVPGLFETWSYTC